MDTVSKLSRYAAHHGSDIRFIGIPKTIDNDLIQTDHTPGYASAAKYVAASVREIALDVSVYQQKAVTIVELMGRAMPDGLRQPVRWPASLRATTRYSFTCRRQILNWSSSQRT